MYIAYLAGGIASGKSTVSRELRNRGACCIDLDDVSRKVTMPGLPATELIAREFGPSMLDEEGRLRRRALARHVFCSQENTQRLEDIVHPAVREYLAQWLAGQEQDALCVVEVPLLDKVEDLANAANEVVSVLCPIEKRRVRAIGRGMIGADFDARAALQPSDTYLASMADTVFLNDGNERDLIDQIDDWWERRSVDHVEFRFASQRIG